MSGRLAFGITAGLRPGSDRLGATIESLGYAELWVNDTRRGDGLHTLADVARSTQRMSLGVGVISLSDHTPRAIAERISSAGVDVRRLTLGVGSGASASVELVRQGVLETRAMLRDVPIAVAAVGPRMLRLAGEVADAAVTAWARPERLEWARARVNEGAAISGRASPRLVAYVRTATGPGATARLQSEMDRYASYGPHYARAMESQPGLVGVAVESGDREDMATALAPYRAAADTVVVRAVPRDDSVDAWLEVAAVAVDA